MTGRADRRADAATWAGFRAASFARSTGTLVVLVESATAGIETDPDIPFATICDDHSSVVCHHTLTAARSFMPAPEQWCEACQRLIETREEADG